MNANIQEIHDCSWDRLDEAVTLLNRTQGEGLFDRKYLRDKIEKPTSCVFASCSGEEVLAVGCAEILSSLEYYLPFDVEIKNRLNERRVGSLCALSVVERFQGKGIGQKMTRARMNWLKLMGCDVVLGVSWVSTLLHTSDRVFEKSGFERKATVREFYKKHALEHPFRCPGCMVQPCECSAILYEYDIEKHG
jgi:ribosomal protein S18 acetylase RimI-like enzyme